ncbi:InlB B-repeat-containing protein, partial [Mesotoga prima]|uniref:InlB B-repeat-containing protein n=1 Tax=Mesotoga prima TaxID=1184387 RepID=UPI002B524DBC
MKKKSLIYLLSLMVIATLFLFSACFRLEPSFTVELETTRELIPVLNLSEYSLTVTVGEGSYVELSADTGLVSEMKVAIAGGKAEIARLFTESSAKELTVSVKNAAGNEIAKKTIALAGKEAEFAVADLATDGIYIPEEPAEGEPLEFYSLDCIRGKTTPERIVILLDLEARGGYILLAGYGWTWEDYLEWLQTGSPAPKEAAELLPTHRAIDKCDGDKLFNAVTGKYIYVLTMSKLDLKPGVGDSGTTDPALGAHEFDEDTIVDLEAFPGENWLFEEWQGDVVGSTVLIDGDKEVTAVFTPIEHLLEIINYFPQGGNVDVAAGNVALVNLPMVPQGAELILTAVPSKNWRFVSWELPYDHSTKNPEYFTMDAPAILKVYFAPIEGKYPLTVGKIGTGEGNTTPVPGIYKFNPGAEVPLTASAASGSRFDRWFVDGLGQTEGAESIVVTIDATTTAMANFIKLWTLNVDKVGEGTTSLESGIYDDGTRLTL